MSTLVIRLAVSFYYNEKTDIAYWEYGPLAENMVAGNGYSLFYKSDLYIPSLIPPDSPLLDEQPYPSAYMMPGYPSFLAAMFILFGNRPDLIIFIVQAILSAFTAILIYKITMNFADKRAAIFAAAIYIFLPEMIYPTVSIGPTSFLHFFLALLLFILSQKPVKELSISNALLIGLIVTALLYLRPAFVVFVGILILYFLLKKYYKQAFVIIIVVTSLLIPWSVRNYMVFNKFIPFTTSTGLNTYRGHNPYYPGFWQDDKTKNEISAYADSSNFEIKMSDVFMDLALKEIKEHPVKEFFTSFEKLAYLWIYYPYDSRTGNPLYLFPWLLLLALFIITIWRSFDFEHKKYIYIVLIACSINSMLFFALLRYQTIMKIAVIPLAAQGIVLIWEKYNRKK